MRVALLACCLFVLSDRTIGWTCKFNEKWDNVGDEDYANVAGI